MKILSEEIRKENIFFINPDVKRGIGVEEILPNYHIICCNFDPIVPILRKQGAKIFCLAEKITEDSLDYFNNTGRLLENQAVLDYINRHSYGTKPKIVFFKPSVKIDILLKRYGFEAIGNRAELNESFENKTSFHELINKYCPQNAIPSKIGILSKMDYETLADSYGRSLVVQFGHGWAGKTTFFISRKEDFIKLTSTFPKTKVKIGKKIDGFTVLNNCVIYNKNILISSPAIQLSGISKLHPNSSVTCGRQWPVKFLSDSQLESIRELSEKIGLLMSEKGFKGFFGLDFIVDRKTGEIFISENNARLTASSGFYAKLELGLKKTPLLLYHIASFLGIEIPIEPVNGGNISGSQVIFRKEVKIPIISSKINYGIYSVNSNTIIKVRKDGYRPYNLKRDEFIYLKGEGKRKSGDLEYSRIETKMNVLKSPGMLADWLDKLIPIESGHSKKDINL
ncbi:hypothetical protein COY59_03965 [Candidatus Gottesmanbacteria bacterium CG_4_10_14_0_8_um_filter_37_24]|nr:MAG: hypothetical protein AUJ73_00545 [Candidatus Gottesmanbacteria bacterium CG1_02_37_22]PIP32860.1 MAG: hypothetical protein COX23_02475 [Candidatus Gottesmanbacteria bacterium CG23_combo_of_CG06-09_8_20_14_all_37_19]PIZ02597.1 MAG: hypothetical protein COY59_03965 [Candidatus Gottesmanbacteria bacterium CG_4_10_14_0_8_um_filter_37_24]